MIATVLAVCTSKDKGNRKEPVSGLVKKAANTAIT